MSYEEMPMPKSGVDVGTQYAEAAQRAGLRGAGAVGSRLAESGHPTLEQLVGGVGALLERMGPLAEHSRGLADKLTGGLPEASMPMVKPSFEGGAGTLGELAALLGKCHEQAGRIESNLSRINQALG